MPLQRDFWESLDVSIDDIIENESKLDDVRKRLTNKLESLFGDCNSLVKQYYGVSGDSLQETIFALFSSSIDNFRELYALATYSENKVNSDYLYEIAITHLTGPITKQVADKTINSRSLLLPLFKTNQDILYDVHYSHLLQCKPVRKFQSNNKLTTSLPFKSTNESKIGSILEEFEAESKAKVKRETKLWRYKTDGANTLVVFRREKRLRSKVSKVERNEYYKTGDQKILLFKDGGNILEICSAKEKRIVKIAEFIFYKLTKQRIKYQELISQYKITRVRQFINDLISNKIENNSLLSVRVQNVALENSPTVELFCEEDVVPALDDLNTNHGLSLLEKTEELLSLGIRLDERAYTLRTMVEGEEIKFLLDNRNLREEDKHKLSAFLEKQMS